MAKKLTHTNISYNLGNGGFWNGAVGVDVYSLDSDPTNRDEWLFIPLDYEGNPTRSSESGYTKEFEWRFKSGQFPDLEQEINLPLSGRLTFQDIITSPDNEKTLWARRLAEKVIDRILEYSIAPTGECKEKTLKYMGLIGSPSLQFNNQENSQYLGM